MTGSPGHAVTGASPVARKQVGKGLPSPPRRQMVPPPPEHGGDGPLVAAALGLDPDRLLDLSMTLNPLAPDPRPVVARNLGAVSRYPDPTRARDALAAAIGVDRHRLVLTNGGAEAIALAAAEIGAGWVEEPEFSLYRRHLNAIDPSRPAFRSNPRNPTGLLAPPGASAGVWDEAFYPLATGRWTRGDADEGALVVGSLTKLLACPGLRVGYVLAPDRGLAGRLARRQPQWSVNALAAASIPELLEVVDLPRWTLQIRELREDLAGLLRRHGLVPRRSDAPWLLVDGVAGLRETLALEGVVVRDCTSFGLAGSARIAVPDTEGIERLERALTAVAGLR